MIQFLMDMLSIDQEAAKTLCGGLITVLFLLAILMELQRLRRNQGQQPIKRKDINANILNDQYRRVDLVEPRFWVEYKKLRSICIGKEFIICPKVSVLGLTEPREKYNNNPALRSRLAGQYIDFVICTKNMQVQALIRLLSSERMDGQAKIDDDYANAVLGTCNYKIIKVWSIEPDILDKLDKI